MNEPIWSVEEIQPSFFKITNRKTKKSYNLLDVEFVYGQGHYNQVVERFPNYIHKQVWELREKNKLSFTDRLKEFF